MAPRVTSVMGLDRMRRRRVAQFCVLLLALAFVAGCATGRAVRRADTAADQGDWDTAATNYREALAHAPGRADLKIKLDRAVRLAASDHLRRARQLEADDQLSGALAEYRQAAELDPTATVAQSKAMELERRIREQSEAARPLPRVDAIREQNAQSSTIPRLDPRAVVPQMRFTNAAVRDLLRTISELTNINIHYDQGLEAALSRPHTIDNQQTPLVDVLNQVLQAQQLTFKVVNSNTIFIYQDTVQKRQQFEDQYIQTFFLSGTTPAVIQQALQQLLVAGGAGGQIPIPPRITVNADGNTITVRATAPVLEVIDSFIRANDRGLPEVLIEAEILEVDRAYVRRLGLDLNQWAVGFTFSPELAPTGVTGTIPLGSPPPFSANTLREGVSASDFYVTSPTALVNLLEQNGNTKVLARPSSRATSGKPTTLTLGSQIPIPNTTFNSAAAGGVANIPTTSVTYTNVGVNLIFTPKVTYQDDIILESLTVEKSGLGANIDVAGQSFPTIVSRRAQSNIRLRDGESTIISGLLLDDDRRTVRSLPGLSNIPILRNLFGNSDRTIEQTDIVMVLTARIVRGHDLTPADLKPRYIGTGSNIGASPTPPLISPEALNTGGPATQSAMSVTGGPGAQTPAGVGPGGVTTAISAPGAARGTEILPIQAPGTPANSGPAPRPAAPRLVLSPPAAGAEGALAGGSGPHSVPIQISGAVAVASVTLNITFDPNVVRMATITQGSFLMQGGVNPTVTAGGAPVPGRLEMTISRPALHTGANGSGVLAALTFVAGSAGAGEIIVTGVVTTTTGQTIPIQATPVAIAVR
jgi:general secretion pathway protein D